MNALTQFAFARLVEDFERRYRIRAICHPDNEAELREMFAGAHIVIRPVEAMVHDLAIIVFPRAHGKSEHRLFDLKAEREEQDPD